MKEFELISVIDYKNYAKSLPKLTRTAVRGIIWQSNRNQKRFTFTVNL